MKFKEIKDYIKGDWSVKNINDWSTPEARHIYDGKYDELEVKRITPELFKSGKPHIRIYVTEDITVN